MRTKLFLFYLGLFIVLSAFAGEPQNTCLVKIERSPHHQLADLADILDLNYRSPLFLLGTIEKQKLNSLTERGYDFTIIDEQAWDQSYYVLTKNGQVFQEIESDNIIYKDDDLQLAKTDQQLSISKAQGYSLYKLQKQSLPFVEPAKIKAGAFNSTLDNSVVSFLVNRVSQTSLYNGLSRLEAFKTRYSGSDSVYSAGQWLYEQFENLGYEVYFDTLSVPVLHKIQRNVIAIKRGTVYPDSIIMIGGHYDSIVGDGSNPMILAPGVDDNGTGTIAALETAKVLRDIDLETTVMFACWAAEEQGLIGSQNWVSRAWQNGLNIGFYLNFDMIGNCGGNNPVCQLDVEADETSNGFADLFIDMLSQYTNIEPVKYPYVGGGSDHYPFYSHGYHTVFAIETDFSPYYHSVQDVLENINMDFYSDVVKAGVATIATVAGPPTDINDAYVSYVSEIIDDDNLGSSKGNGNNYLEPGETVELAIQVENIGNTTTHDVRAELVTSDPFITIIDSSAVYGDLGSNVQSFGFDNFVFSISSDVPNNHPVNFYLMLQSSEGQTWVNSFIIRVRQPDMKYISFSTQETNGDEDEIPEAGETCNLYLLLKNTGFRHVNGLKGLLESNDPYVEILQNESVFSSTILNNFRNTQSPFQVRIDENAPPHHLEFGLKLYEDDGTFLGDFKVCVLINQPKTLLVIDDGDAQNYWPYLYAFSEIGISADLFLVNRSGTVPYSTLSDYENVIWFTGKEPVETLTDVDQVNLERFLKNGGRLLLSGPLVGYRLYDKPFYTEVLHSEFINESARIFHIENVPGNGVVTLDTLSLEEENNSWPVEIDPIEPAFPILLYKPRYGEGIVQSSGTAALAVDDGTYKLVYCVFGIENIISLQSKSQFIGDVFDWFRGAALDQRPKISVFPININDGPGIGNNDGYVNPGELIEFCPVIKNTSSFPATVVSAILYSDDENVTVIDSTAVWGTIPGKGQKEAEDNFVVRIADNCPDYYDASLHAVFKDQHGFTWDFDIPLVVRKTSLVNINVTDSRSSNMIPGAQLIVEKLPVDLAVNNERKIFTQADGSFVFHLPKEPYQITVKAQGYAKHIYENVIVQNDTTFECILYKPQLSIVCDTIVVSMQQNGIRRDSVILKNNGTGSLVFTAFENKYPLNGAIKNKDNGKESAFEPISNESSVMNWRRVYTVPKSSDEKLLGDVLMRHDATTISFWQEFNVNAAIYQHMNYDIWIDADCDSLTGMPFRDLGIDRIIRLTWETSQVMYWLEDEGIGAFTPVLPYSSPVSVTRANYHFESVVTHSQIAVDSKMKFLVAFSPNGEYIEFTPSDGLYYITYAPYNASWYESDIYSGIIGENDSTVLRLYFDTYWLSLGGYQNLLVFESNDPQKPVQTLLIKLNVGTSGVDGNLSDIIPQKYGLAQNYPNPLSLKSNASFSTTIKYQLPAAQNVDISIYNILGQKVKTIINEKKQAGYYQAVWDGRSFLGQYVPSGIYFYRIKAGEYVQNRKMLVIN